MELVRRIRAQVQLLPLLLVSIPFAIGAIQLLIETRQPLYLTGDQALLDIAVRRSVEFLQLVGPYSRYSWSHPGPMSFFFFAPATLAFDSSVGLYLGALLTNWLFVSLGVGLLGRRLPQRTTLSIVVILMIYMIALGPTALRDPWNPQIVVLPLLAALFAVVVRPSVRSMCFLAVATSLALQSHIGTIGIIASLLFTVVAVHLLAAKLPTFSWLRHARSAGLWPGLRPTLAVAAVTLICWSLPIVEQLANGRSGNFGRVVHYNLTSHGEAKHTLSEGFTYTLGGSWLPDLPLLVPPPQPPGPDLLWVVLWLAAAAGGCFLAFKRQLRAPFVLLLFSAVGFLLVSTALSRVSGQMFVYLLWWVAIPAVALLMGWAALVFGEDGLLSGKLQGLSRGALVGATVVVAFFSIGSTLGNKSTHRFSRDDVREATALVTQSVGDREGVLILELPDPSASLVAYGVVDQLVREGHPVRTVDPQNRPVETRGSKGDVIATFRIAAAGSGNNVGGTVLGSTNTGESVTVRRIS